MVTLAKPIVLIGLMGAGKTTIGSRLGKMLKVDFVDSDHEIEEAAGCTVSDMFDLYGEEVFRDLELKVIRRLLGKKQHIIATGGGAFVQPAVKELIERKAFTVWLRADIDTLIDRVSRRDTRPLLAKGNKRKILSKLIQDRYPVYAEADMTIDSNYGAHDAVVKTIYERICIDHPKLVGK